MVVEITVKLEVTRPVILSGPLMVVVPKTVLPRVVVPLTVRLPAKVGLEVTLMVEVPVI